MTFRKIFQQFQQLIENIGLFPLSFFENEAKLSRQTNIHQISALLGCLSLKVCQKFYKFKSIDDELNLIKQT